MGLCDGSMEGLYVTAAGWAHAKYYTHLQNRGLSNQENKLYGKT